MSEPGQCCGTCKHSKPIPTQDSKVSMLRCHYPLPITVPYRGAAVYPYEGHDCPCYEQSGEAEGK